MRPFIFNDARNRGAVCSQAQPSRSRLSARTGRQSDRDWLSGRPVGNQSQACPGVSRLTCCDVWIPKGGALDVSIASGAADEAIACTSWELLFANAADPVGAAAPKPPNCQFGPTCPNKADPVTWLLAMS